MNSQNKIERSDYDLYVAIGNKLLQELQLLVKERLKTCQSFPIKIKLETQ